MPAANSNDISAMTGNPPSGAFCHMITGGTGAGAGKPGCVPLRWRASPRCGASISRSRHRTMVINSSQWCQCASKLGDWHCGLHPRARPLDSRRALLTRAPPTPVSLDAHQDPPLTLRFVHPGASCWSPEDGPRMATHGERPGPPPAGSRPACYATAASRGRVPKPIFFASAERCLA